MEGGGGELDAGELGRGDEVGIEEGGGCGEEVGGDGAAVGDVGDGELWVL